VSAQPVVIEPQFRVVLPEAAATCIVQVGVGGTGSWLALSLARLVYHARQKGQVMRLVLVDPDVIEPANVGRQAFCSGEVGCNKAESMALRLNLALGLDITAVAAPFTAEMMSWVYRQHQEQHQHSRRRTRFVLVGAVDNHLARRELAEAVSLGDGHVWAVDCGNARSNGQVLVGNLTDLDQLRLDRLGLCTGLPSPYIQEPGLLEPDPEDEPALSCAHLTLREEQSLLINAQVAAVAAQLVYDLAVTRTVRQYAVYFNLEPPTMSSRLITNSALRRFRQPASPPNKGGRDEEE
jgi:PRTRC genetic system ThiF family protein